MIKCTGYVLYTVEGIYCYWSGRSSMQTATTAIADTTTTGAIVLLLLIVQILLPGFGRH